MSDIFKARTADDVGNYLDQIEITAQDTKPGSVNLCWPKSTYPFDI